MVDVGDPYVGMRLADRYELLERIGEGGMGVVYRARQLHLDRAVAIKVLRQRTLRDPARIALFRKEAEALARLQHPNTVRIFELGTFDGGPFVAMELLDGRTLAVEIARARAMPVARTLKILAQLCSSLEEAHRAGIVHGDIKPQNVFLLDVEGATDHVKLVDFSLAQLAGSEPDDARFMGTPGYASPELLGGGPARPASDVYACGVVAFQMLTGALPSSNRADMMRALLAEVPESVALVVLRAMEHDVARRYPGVAELRHDSERAAVAGDARSPLRRDAPSWPHSGSTISTWDNPAPQLRRRWFAEGLEFGDLAWSRDGRWLAINAHDAIRLVELETTHVVTVPCAVRLLSADRHGFLIGGPDRRGIIYVDPDAAVAGRALSSCHDCARPDLISCSPDGSSVAIAAGRKLFILDRATWATATEVEFSARLSGLDWRRRGNLLAIGLEGETAVVLDMQARALVHLPVGGRGESPGVIDLRNSDAIRELARDFPGSPHTGPTRVSWDPDGAMLAVTTDRTELWAAADWSRLATLDTVHANQVSLAASSPLLASIAFNELTLWRHDQPSALTHLYMPFSHTMGGQAVAFHPTLPTLAATFPGGIAVYDIDVDALLAGPNDVTVHYANAKVVMVGESGVGKSALGLVLTGNEFRPTESTHGRHIWTLSSETARVDGGVTAHRETLLWDLAGQPGYRVFHRQHLDEVSVALVLYDARSETDPFAGVSYWARALDDATRGFPITKFLVASRIDRGGTAASDRQLGEIAARHGFARCFETSARRGDGVERLAEAIHGAIAWERLPLISAFRLFYDVKVFVLAQKLRGTVLQPRGELRARLEADLSIAVPPASFDACVGQLEAAGLVKRLSFCDLVLLQPELLDSYAAWMALAARQEPAGLGFLSERAARAGTFHMDLDRLLRGRPDEHLLLAATIEDVVGRGIALLQPTEQGEMLVFPSELRDDMPDGAPEEVKTVAFTFEGPVKSVYATLAVCLTHAPAFTQHRLFRNAAVFHSMSGETCGFRMDYPRPQDDGYGSLTVFFDAAATLATKLTFLRYINRQLQRMAFRDTVRCERVYYCGCGYPSPVRQAALEWRKRRGERTVICEGCGAQQPIDTLAEQSVGLDRVVEQQIEESDAERERQRRLSVMPERERGAEHDVFLCHNSRDTSVVKRLDSALRELGILPWLDDKEILPGEPLVPALEAVLDRIPCAAVVIGPHALGKWQEHEYHAILQRMIDHRSERGRRPRIVPVLIPGAAEVPTFLRSLAHADFRDAGLDDRREMRRLVDAILSARTRDGRGAR